MTLETILSYFAILSFIATCAVLLIGARLYAVAKQQQRDAEGGAERLWLGIGGGAFTFHAHSNRTNEERNLG